MMSVTVTVLKIIKLQLCDRHMHAKILLHANTEGAGDLYWPAGI